MAPPPVTVTNAVQVQDIAWLINRLTPGPLGPTSCPADFGGQDTLTFRARPGGPVIATAFLPLSGCAFVDIADNGKQATSPGPGDSASAVLARITKITGLSVPGQARRSPTSPAAVRLRRCPPQPRPPPKPRRPAPLYYLTFRNESG